MKDLPPHDVVAYYDALAARKLRDFVDGNERVEQGWERIVEWSSSPARILEIGCGVGSICWRMSRHFPNAKIVGVDFSGGNLEVAERVFASPNIKFVLTSGTDAFEYGRFDLIVLMDVYEHVAVAERANLHDNLKRSLSADGLIVLTFPTPRHLAWLRANSPNDIQPVDEDVTVEALLQLAEAVEKDLLMYQEVDVWRCGDYGHAVIGTSRFPAPAAARPQPRFDFAQRRERNARRDLIAKAGLKT